MKTQEFSNHVRYYTPHHFILLPILIALIILSASYIFKFPENDREWKMFTALTIMVVTVAFMTRQHYALTLQNRIVRLELRLRYYQLTGLRLENIEHRLTIRQIAALRFASDEELPTLVEKTVEENLRPSTIKRSIKNWLPDYMRV